MRSRLQASRRATATPVEGGYWLTGRWPFSSGSAHAQWAVVGAFVERDGKPDAAPFARVPMSDIKIIDDWHDGPSSPPAAARLSSTTCSCPSIAPCASPTSIVVASPGRPVHPDYALLRAPRPMFAVFSQSPVTIALGRRALDLVVAGLRHRMLRSGGKADQSELVQSKLAESASEIEMAALCAE